MISFLPENNQSKDDYDANDRRYYNWNHPDVTTLTRYYTPWLRHYNKINSSCWMNVHIMLISKILKAQNYYVNLYSQRDKFQYTRLVSGWYNIHCMDIDLSFSRESTHYKKKICSFNTFVRDNSSKTKKNVWASWDQGNKFSMVWSGG